MLKKLFMIVLVTFLSFFAMHKIDAITLTTEKLEGTFYSTHRKNGEEFSATFRMYSFGSKTAYCIEPTIQVTTDIYVAHDGMMKSPYSAEINKRISLIGYYGYDYPGHKTNRYRMATQELIWEATNGIDVKFFTERFFQGEEIDISKEKNEILKLVNSHNILPSFNRTTVDTVIGTKIEIEDTNKVLSDFEVYSSPNAEVEINGNVLSITPTAVGELSIIFSKKSYTKSQTQVFIGEDPDSQILGHFGMSDPVNPRISVNSIGGKVTLEKLDSKTLSFTPTSADATLGGAIYGIYDEDDVRIGEVITKGDSAVTSDYLPKLGTFYLKEEKSSQGYELDSTKYYFEVTEDNLDSTITVHEKIIEREVEIFKVFADGTTTILKGEPDVTFEFYLKSNNELYATATTDENGRLSVVLPYGTYVVKQKTSTSGYEKVEDFEIKINYSSDNPLTKIISNAEISAKLKLVKIDSESKRVLVKDGIKFKIKNLDTGEYVCQSVTYPSQERICTFETKDGVFITPYVLSTGNYQIEELEDQVIDGYLWNSTPFKFSINEESNFIYDSEYGVMLEVQFENTEVKGEVEVNKFGEKVVKENGSYHYEEIKLDGVTYELYADEDIYSSDGTLIYNAKQLVDTYITKDGYFKISNLYLGKYCLIETATVNGHKLDSTKHCFTLSYKDQYTPVVSLSFTFKNYLEKGKLDFTKIDLTSGKEIPNVKLEIYDAEDNLLIYSGITDKNGKIKIDNLYVGKFYIVETDPATGYKLTDEKVEFEITKDGEVVKAKMTNEKITGKLIFKKVDEDGNTLAGVKINLYDSENNLIGTYITSEDGLVIIEQLEYGDYMIKEVSTIDGYELSDETLYISIVEDGVEINVSMVNKKLPQTDMNDYSKAISISLIILGFALFIVTYLRKKINK